MACLAAELVIRCKIRELIGLGETGLPRTEAKKLFTFTHVEAAFPAVHELAGSHWKHRHSGKVINNSTYKALCTNPLARAFQRKHVLQESDNHSSDFVAYHLCNVFVC